MIDRPATDVGRRRQHWKLAIFGPYVLGILGLFVGLLIERQLAGSVLYLAGIVGGTVAGTYACFRADVTVTDERFAALERRASHYTILTVAYVGLAIFPLLFVLDTAGEFAFDPTTEALLYGFSALGLLWSAIYAALRARS